jgi:transcriptional regulator with XRE-family HTH domain
LGTLLQARRHVCGYTQSELAERANLSLKYLGEVERGEANVTVDALERIAIALEWDPWELFSNERTPVSQGVHGLLVAELTAARDRLETVIDWLRAVDPATRASQREEEQRVSPQGRTPKADARAGTRQRRRALPRRQKRAR